MYQSILTEQTSCGAEAESDLEETPSYWIRQLGGTELPQDLLASYCIYSYNLIQYHVLLMKLIKIREANLNIAKMVQNAISVELKFKIFLGGHAPRPPSYQNSSMGFVNQFVKIEYIFKIKKYCII